MAPVRDYSHLSDEELGQKLEAFGMDIGPVNMATRKTYERKLFKLETGQDSPASQKYEPVNDVDDDDEVQIRAPPQRHQPQPKAPSHPEPSQPRQRRDFPDASTSSSSYTPRIESRANLNAPRKATSTYSDTVRSSYTRPAPQRATAQSSSPSPRPAESKGIPLWVTLVSVLVVAVLVYLIYSNMEPQAVSSIPEVSQKVEV